MKLISFNMFETVASDANDKYHKWVYNKLSFNANQSISIDLHIQFNMKIPLKKVCVEFDNNGIAFICRLGSIVSPF